jgi:hypothetical protein
VTRNCPCIPASRCPGVPVSRTLQAGLVRLEDSHAYDHFVIAKSNHTIEKTNRPNCDPSGEGNSLSCNGPAYLRRGRFPDSAVSLTFAPDSLDIHVQGSRTNKLTTLYWED